MAWVKVWAAGLDSPEVWQLAIYLSIDPDSVVAKLIRVVEWFSEHAKGNSAPKDVKQLLDSKVKRVGFCDAMIKYGLMQEYNGKVTLEGSSLLRWVVVRQ